MRIDEFTAPGDIDGELSAVEITRFLTAGYDLTIPVQHPREYKRYDSQVTNELSELSQITTKLAGSSQITIKLSRISTLEE